MALLDGTYLSEEKRSQQKQQEDNRDAETELSELKRKATDCMKLLLIIHYAILFDI